jgi:hypothetical protein
MLITLNSHTFLTAVRKDDKSFQQALESQDRLVLDTYFRQKLKRADAH